MNLLEHYIDEVISVKDVTDKYTRSIGKKPHSKLFEVVCKINCYGHKEEVKKHWFESEWNRIKEQGYYMS